VTYSLQGLRRLKSLLISPGQCAIIFTMVILFRGIRHVIHYVMEEKDENWATTACFAALARKVCVRDDVMCVSLFDRRSPFQEIDKLGCVETVEWESDRAYGSGGHFGALVAAMDGRQLDFRFPPSCHFRSIDYYHKQAQVRLL
jgi:hypothetical protein